MLKRPLPHAVAIAASLLLATAAQAQALPDPAATLKRDTEQAERALHPPPLVKPGAAAPLLEAAKPGGVRFALNSIVFSPSGLLSTQELTALAQPLLGQTVDQSQLQQLVEQINALYRQKGVLTAQAMLPEQELRNGEVRVLLVEGKVGLIALSGNTSLSEAYVLDRLQVPVGQLADSAALGRAVRRFNASNDARAELTLRPGAEFGRTDVLVNLEEQARNQLRLLADNYGLPSTGVGQGTVSFRRLSSLTEGDRFDVYAIHTDGVLTGRVAYDIPVGKEGARLGVSQARNQISYTLPGAANQHYAANATTDALDTAFPLLVSDVQLVRLLGSLNRTRSNNLIDDTPLTDSEVRHLNLTLQGDLEGRGWRASWTLGKTWLQWQGSGMEQGGAYTDANLSLLASVTDSAYLRATLSARAAPEDLPSSERYTLGGVNSLRGYSSGSLSGNQGRFTQIELHQEWRGGPQSRADGHALDAYLFADYGQVSGPAQSAWSAGLGSNWTLPGGMRLEAFAAHVGMPELTQSAHNFGVKLLFNINF